MSDLPVIRRLLSYLKEPGEVVELRANEPDGGKKIRWHGFYDDHEKLARDAADFGRDCFFTVNELDPSIPATNKLERCKRGRCSSADKIVRRTLLYLDCDPVRETGTPSTDAQHAAAIDLVKHIVKQIGFPLPIIGDTGNGACAFWKIDLKPDSTLPKRVLKAIKAKFETPTVAIDLTVASVARIGRLLGTDNKKARRQSTILDAPTKTLPAEKIINPTDGSVVGERPEETIDGELELLSEAAMEAFAPEPKKKTEAKRVQLLVTSRNFGETVEERVEFFHQLLKEKKPGYDYKLDKSHWFHIPCVFRPDQCDALNWIEVNEAGVTGGCHHRKCQGKGLLDILSIIAPELAAQAGERFDDSHRLGRLYLKSRPPLAVWNGQYYSYRDGAYHEESAESVKAELNLGVKGEFNRLGFDETPNVTTKIVGNVESAVKAVTFDRAEISPHWRKANKHPAEEYLSFKNGLLHVPSYFDGVDCFAPHSSDYFTLGVLPYDFDPNAPDPENFLDYCNFQWDDPKVHLLLQEILGDILLADPRRRVFYNWLGKPRAGKSSLIEMVEGLVGERNRCAVELDDFATDFGLEDAIGKKLILISEAKVDRRHAGDIAEKIKRISGCDLLPIKRKFKTALSVRLNAKIVAVSNHLPKLIDDSGALFDRLIPLQFTKSIEPDKVDREFPLKLKAELPGIVLLALEGWKRLRDQGNFTMPDSSKQLLSELRETGSPVLTFVEDRCQLIGDGFTPTESLFNAWESFCIERGFTAGNVENFTTALKSAAPELKKDRRSLDRKMCRGFSGIIVRA